MWTLPSILLVPEISGSPLFILFIGVEIWLALIWLQFAIPIGILSALFGRNR